MTVCMTVVRPLAGVLVVVWGMDMGPLLITKPEYGFRFAPAMGLDGVVCRSSSDWYGYEFELEVVWPSNGVEGHREWS